MLIGRFYHALEQKGRLSIPSVFREEIGEEAILTGGLDGCLFLYDINRWQRLLKAATAQPFTKKAARDWVRYLANNALPATFDSNGRIQIPDYLREKAGLTKHTVIVGSVDLVEIWDRDRYHTYLDNVSQSVEAIAENVTRDES